MNIDEVARRARVSTATVSRTISGTTPVRSATAERVRKAIEELGYVPNFQARSLSSGRSHLYGLVLSDITNPFFPDLLFAFEHIALEHGIEVLLANTNYDAVRMESCIFRFMARKVDGIAVMTSEMTDHLLDRLAKCTIPLVFLNQESVHNFPNIRVEYGEGFTEAIEHLLGLGHTEIGFISGPLELSSVRRRYAAFIASMQAKDLSIHEEWNRSADHRVEGGYEAMKEILAQKRRPTAVVCSNDLTAIGAMNAVRERKLRIPEDISIVGFDDIQMASLVVPRLTTIRLSREDIARRAFQVLFHAGMADMDSGPQSSLSPQLVIRETTGPHKGRR